MKSIVRILADVEELNRAAAAEFVRLANEAVKVRGKFTVALSGGSTPKKLYELLADSSAPYCEQVPWNETLVFFGDERLVLPDHTDSNYRMARESMLAHVPVRIENVYRMATERGDAFEVAQDYERKLRRAFQLEQDDVPRFDLVLLGLGTDGHTASLFPGTTALGEENHFVVANWVEKFNAYRLTLTLPIINNAAVGLFLVSGSDKAQMVAQVLDEKHSGTLFPAQLVRPANGELIWLVDQAAASLLPATNLNLEQPS